MMDRYSHRHPLEFSLVVHKLYHTLASMDRGGPTNLDKIHSRDKWNSVGYAAAASR
jgi:hypothetical protein